MSDHPFLRFIELVNFDQKIQSLDNEKAFIDIAIAATKKQEDQLVQDLHDMHKHIVQLKKRVDECELEMKTLDNKEKDKKERLECLSDYKEYQAIKSEIEAIQRLQMEQEQNVLDAWNQLENAQFAEKKKTQDNANQLHNIHAHMKELEEKLRLLHSEYTALISQRAEKESRVPAEWLEKYVLMRARVSNPVVEIFHGSCGVCSQMVTAQDLVRAKRGALLQCQTCFRLLYAPEIMEKHEAA